MARDLYAVAAAQLADVVTFYAAAAIIPLEHEVDPLVQGLVAVGGIGAVLILKIVVLGGMLWLITRMRAAPDWVQITGLSLVIGAGLSGAAANLVSLSVALR
jgi:hypothetical protein